MRRHFRGAAGGRPRRAGTVAIVGDLTHSRVARSNVLLLHDPRRRGDAGRAADPDAERGRRLGRPTGSTSHDLDAVLPTADAVMMLRVQRERMSGGYFPTAREYTVGYGLTRAGCGLLPDPTRRSATPAR